MIIPIPFAKVSPQVPASPDRRADAQAPPIEPEAITVVAPPVISTRLSHRRRRPSFLIGSILFLIFSTGGVAAGYLVLDRLGMLPQFNHAELATQPLDIPARPSEPSKRYRRDSQEASRKSNNVVSLEPRSVIRAETLAAPPSHFELPEHTNTRFVELCAASRDIALSISSVDPNLEFDNKTILWSADGNNTQPVAALALAEGKLLFRWIEDPPIEAIAAVHNAVLTLDSPLRSHLVSMRTPVIADPMSLDLQKPVVRILCKCEYAPSLESIYFTLVPDSKFPEFETTGRGLANLQLRDETILWFAATKGVGTRMSLTKKGNVVAVEMYTRYRLPSGDEGTLTISNGRKKRKEIERHSPSNPKVRRELQAFNNISKLALDVILANSFDYRFFMIIDGHEVDLVVSGR